MKKAILALWALAGLCTSCCCHSYHDECVEEGIYGPYPSGVFEERNYYDDNHYYDDHHHYYHRHG